MVTLVLFCFYLVPPLEIMAGAILAHFSVICGHLILALIVKNTEYKYPKVLFSAFADVGIKGEDLVNRYMGNPMRAAAKYAVFAVGAYFIYVGGSAFEYSVAEHLSGRSLDSLRVMYQKANLPLANLADENVG